MQETWNWTTSPLNAEYLPWTRRGSTRGTWRSFDTCILKASADAPSEGPEGHWGVWTMDIEEEAIMANV
jgi:hypothetical protein